MLQVGNYPPGSNLTLLNVIYKNRSKNPETDKWEKDYAMLLYKDNDTGEKHYEVIYEPNYTYYLLKPELQSYPGEHFRELDDLIPVTCKYNSITKSIAESTGNIDLFYKNIQEGNYSLNRMFFTHERIFGADYNIRNYLMIQFAETYQNPMIDLDIIFFDIESDIINCLTDVIGIGDGEVNLISMYCTKTKTMYSFILRNKLNPQIEQLENNIKSNFETYKEKYRKFVIEQVGEEKALKYNLVNSDISVGFFDTEEELIITFFNVVKQLNCEILCGWNSNAYDIRQLLERLKMKGIDVVNTVPDQFVFPKLCDVNLDERHIDKFEERTDTVDITFKSLVLDQMLIYASRRKGQKALESYSLDFIGEHETGMRKLNYHNIVTNIARFCWENFELFWWYNIEDVLMLAGIEAQTEDLKFTINNMIEMRTPVDKIYRQTNFLSTKIYEFYKQHENIIIGENLNKFGKAPSTKFPGAFVANPELLSNKNRVNINNHYIMKYNNSNDFDYKALYPSLLKEFNMSQSTLIGMIQFENPPFQDKPFITLDPGGTYLENLASYNFIEFCHRWMNLANIEEVLIDLDEYFSTYRTPLYKGKGNLPLDINKKVIAYKTNKAKPFYLKRPIPDYIQQEVNKIREEIILQ